jgi:hypothetical protein
VGGGNDKGLALIPGPYTSQHGIVGLAAHANGTATRVGNGTMPGSSSETPSAWRTDAGSSVSIHAPSLTRTSRKTSNVTTSACGSTRMRWPFRLLGCGGPNVSGFLLPESWRRSGSKGKTRIAFTGIMDSEANGNAQECAAEGSRLNRRCYRRIRCSKSQTARH